METSCEWFLSSSPVEKPAVSNLFLFPLLLPGQGAITLHCLQRTPDQTITLSGSRPVQTAPMGSDSTDKRALGPPRHREERDLGPPESKDSTVFLNFLPSVPCYQMSWENSHTAAQLVPPAVVWNWQGARNSRRKSNMLFSLPSPVCLTLWLWTSSGLTVMIPLRDAPHLHLSPLSVPSSSRMPARQKQRLSHREEEMWWAIVKWDELVLVQQLLPSNNTTHHFSPFMFLIFQMLAD